MNVKCITKNCPNNGVVYAVTMSLQEGENVMCGPCWNPQKITDEPAWSQEEVLAHFLSHPNVSDEIKNKLL